MQEFVDRADWAWYEDYRHNRREDLPLIVSEFGNWGLPNPDLLAEKGKDPWWFETGYASGDGIVYPHGMADRFHYYGLDAVFGTLDNFTAQHQRHMSKSLAYEVATMRRYPRIGGYVITEFTDVHWECNGLLDMQRNVKQNLDEFVALNQDRVVVVRPQQWSGRPRASIPVEIHAFDVDGAGASGTLHWHAGDVSGEIALPGGTVEIPLPANPAMLMIRAEWRSTTGELLAQGEAEVAVAMPVIPARRVYCVGESPLSQLLADQGYTLAATPNTADVILTRRYTADLQTAVQQGAHVLVLAGVETGKGEGEVRLPVGGVIPRAGTGWQGDWATSFSWMRKEGPLAALPGDPLLEMEYADIMPDAVITGIPVWNMKAHSWANLALGWIHKPVSLLAVLPYGQGQVTVSTFNLNDEHLRDNVIAQTLLAGMVEMA